MNAVQTAEHARALLETFGTEAEIHAARKANSLRKTGEHLHAAAWLEVRKAIREMREGHVS